MKATRVTVPVETGFAPAGNVTGCLAAAKWIAALRATKLRVAVIEPDRPVVRFGRREILKGPGVTRSSRIIELPGPIRNLVGKPDAEAGNQLQHRQMPKIMKE